MDGTRFDDVPKRLVDSTPSRRGLLRLGVGGGLAALAIGAATDVPLATPTQRAVGGRRAGQEAETRRTKTSKKPKRKIVTRTFSNPRTIKIPGGTETEGPASPYPSTITVNGLTKGRILDVNLTLKGFSHQHPGDVDILLVSPDGRAALVMSDAGDNEDVTDLTITLDDQAVTPLPMTDRLTSGSFQPTNHVDVNPDAFPAPAPQGVTHTALNVFRGINPNGKWELFVADDAGGDTGRISDGWRLTIKARVTTRTKSKRARRPT